MASKKDAQPSQPSQPVGEAGTNIANTGFCTMTDVNFSNMMTEEFNGLDLAFERIKIPSGGGLTFEVPSDDPDRPETVTEFSAVILYHHPLLVYYKDKYTGGNMPPDCSSFDAETGEGDPGGLCSVCKLNKFGTGENGAKACKARRRLYLLREGEIFPMILSLPTGSLKPFTRYLMRLYSKGGRESNSVVTQFSLKKAVNSTRVEYSQAQFAVDCSLTPEERTVINGLSEQVKAFSRAVGVNNADYDEATVGSVSADDDGETLPF